MFLRKVVVSNTENVGSPLSFVDGLANVVLMGKPVGWSEDRSLEETVGLASVRKMVMSCDGACPTTSWSCLKKASFISSSANCHLAVLMEKVGRQ